MLKIAVQRNPNAIQKSAKFWANYLFGENRQSKA